MTTRVITPVAGDDEPVTLAQVAEHLRLPGDPAELPDAELLSNLIVVAREWCEEYTQRAFATQTLETAFQGFPAIGPLRLRPPVQSVTSVAYLDRDGVSSLLPGGERVDILAAEPAEVWPRSLWPIGVWHAGESVRVRYVTGYTAGGVNDPTPGLPRALYAAMLLVIGDLYENREGAIVAVSYAPNPTVQNLLAPYRLGQGL